MTDLLRGLTVLDLSQGMAGSLATMLLADNGARVIKIEPPEGDSFRTILPFKVWNRGKESIVLDLKKTDDRDKLYELCRRSDVLVQSFRPCTLPDLGIDYETLHGIAPQLIYAAISGSGLSGSHRDEAGYEALLAARYGVYTDQRGARSGPHFCPQPGGSVTAGLLAVIGILAALRHRMTTGIGQCIDTSLQDGLAVQHVMYWGWSEKPMVKIPPGYSSGKLRARTLLQLGIMKCADGQQMMIHTGAPGRFTRALEVFGLKDRITPSNTPHEMTVPLSEEEAELIETEVRAQLASEPRASWIQKIQEADIAVAEVDPPGRALEDPQAVYNGAVGRIQDPDLGDIRVAGPPLMTKQVTHGVADLKAAPTLGEHTAAVFKELNEKPWAPTLMPEEATPSRRSAPLEGLKVLDFGAFFAGPFGPKMLADLGADVIKVEPLQRDPMRALTGTFGPAQRGKRCIALDLKSEKGREIAYRLVQEADMVSQNMRPGTAERLGIGFEQLKEINPSLTYMYAPGWGSSGPKSKLQSFAPLLSAFCGLMVAAGGEGNMPVGSAAGNEDTYNALLGACGLLMGKIKAEQSGQGQYVESPQLNSTLTATSEVIVDSGGKVLSAFQNDKDQTGFGPLYRIYQCKDEWICLVVFKEKEWHALTRAEGLNNLATDERFADAGARQRHANDLAKIIEAWCAERTAEEACRSLKSAGVPCEKVYPTQNIDYFFDEENLETERVVEYEHPLTGKMREVGRSIRFSETPGPVLRPFPGFGEHTKEILVELGYAEDEIDTLQKENIVAWDPAPAAKAAE